VIDNAIEFEKSRKRRMAVRVMEGLILSSLLSSRFRQSQPGAVVKDFKLRASEQELEALGNINGKTHESLSRK
jgi:hypothetical protein